MLNSGSAFTGTWEENEDGLSLTDTQMGALSAVQTDDRMVLELPPVKLTLKMERDLPISHAADPQDLVGTWNLSSIYAHGVVYSQEEAYELIGSHYELAIDETLSGKVRHWSDTKDESWFITFTVRETEGIGTMFDAHDYLANGTILGYYSAFMLEDGRIEMHDESDSILYFTKTVDVEAEN